MTHHDIARSSHVGKTFANKPLGTSILSNTYVVGGVIRRPAEPLFAACYRGVYNGAPYGAHPCRGAHCPPGKFPVEQPGGQITCEDGY